MSYWGNQSNKSMRGGSLLLFLMALPVVILFFALAMQLGAYTVGVEQAKATAKMILLAASEAYFRHECGEGTPADECHGARMTAALGEANALASARLGGALSPIIRGDFSSEPYENERLLIDGRYAVVKPPVGGENPCNDNYPCFYERSSGELANAFKFKGSVNRSPILQKFEKLFGINSPFKSIHFEITAAAVPMRMCAVIDLSGSIAADTHPQDSTFSRPLFAYKAQDETGLVVEEQQTSANALPDERTENNPHIKSDYALVQVEDLSTYNSDYTLHRMPDSGSYVTTADAPVGQRLYLLDLYRSGGYMGAEPWVSIMEGVRGVAQAFKARAVAGDRISLVFFDRYVRWPYVVKMTDNFDYAINLLNTEAPSSFTPCPPNAGGGEGCTALSEPPLWIKLGLFPQPFEFTDVYAGLGQALYEFANDNLGVPSVDFVTLFSDGLANCYVDNGVHTCRAGNYVYYRTAMRDIRDKLIAPASSPGYFKGNIALHMFISGAEVGPHTLLLDDGGKCLTDEEARKKKDSKGFPAPIDFVIGQGFSVYDPNVNLNGAQTALGGRNADAPFYQANQDWYHLVRMTGGRWAPLRNQPYCSPLTLPICTTEPERLLQDPECRSIGDQVRAYLNQILRESSGFTIVYDN